MICVYISEEDQQQCDSDLQHDFSEPGPASSAFSRLLASPPRLGSRAYVLAQRALWAGLERAVVQCWPGDGRAGADPQWLLVTVLPCLAGLLARLLPVWLCSWAAAALFRLLGWVEEKETSCTYTHCTHHSFTHSTCFFMHVI